MVARSVRIEVVFFKRSGQKPATEGHGALFGCFSIGLADLAKSIAASSPEKA